MADKPPELVFYESLSAMYLVAVNLPDQAREVLLTEAKKMEQAFLVSRIDKLEYRKLALTDPLTKLPNREGMMRDIKERLESMRRFRDRSLSVAMIDLDGFKAINDQCGHLVGDQALIRVGEALQHTFRGTDSVARYGGDEIVLVLSHAQNERWEEAAIRDKIRSALSGADFIFWDNNGKPHPLGASIGLSHKGHAEVEKGMDLHQFAKEMVAEADAAMYRDKGEKDRRQALRLAQALEEHEKAG